MGKKIYIFITIVSLFVLLYEGIFFGKEYFHIYPEGDYLVNFTANLVNASYLKKGIIPFWNPLSFGGFSAIGTDHYETNPINPMVIFPYLSGINSNVYFLLFFFVVSLISAYSYFRFAFDFTTMISFIGAFIYTNAIFPPTNMNDGLVFACFPLALFIIHKYFKECRFRFLIWLSILMTVIFLSSFCHRFLDMMFLIFLYYFLLSFKYKKKHLRSFLSYCCFALILTGLCAVTLFPQIFTAFYETRRNRPMIFEELLSIRQSAEAVVSFIITHFIVPFKSVYIDFEDFSLKISRFIPLNPGSYLSIFFIPSVLWLIFQRKTAPREFVKGLMKIPQCIFFLTLFLILLIPAPYITVKLRFHEQAYFALHYLQGYISSVIQLFLIIPILFFLKKNQEDNRPSPFAYKAALVSLLSIIALLSVVFIALSAGYLIGEKKILNITLSFYEKIKNLIPYDLNYAFLKKIADYFLRSQLTVFIIALLIVKLLILRWMFSLKRIGLLFLFLLSLDCILPHKIYLVAHDDYVRLWRAESDEKKFFEKLKFSDRIAIRSLASGFIGEGWCNIDSADLPEYFFKKDLASIRRRAWFPDYRYRNPGYALYGHSVFLVSAWQGVNHLLPAHVKDYTLMINQKIGRNKVDCADLLVLDIESHLIDVAGINYIFSSLPLEKPGLELLFKGRQYYVYRNGNAFQKAYFAARYRQFSEKVPAEDVFNYLLTMDDRHATIISNGGIASADFIHGESPRYSIDFIMYSPNKIILNAATDSSGFLILSDTYYPGWSVSVDGKKEPIYRANMAFRAVFLRPGSHSVEFTYRPVGFMAGIAITGLTVLFVAGVLLFNRKTRTVL